MSSMAANLPGGVSPQATEINQRLFRKYAKVLKSSNDVAAYISHAEKLAIWLRDYKAYYDTARPQIVELLLIAQVTLRRSLGISDSFTVPFNVSDYPGNPMVQAYTALVKSVAPFQHYYFQEPAFLAHIKFLLATISPYPPADLPSQTQSEPPGPPPNGTGFTDPRRGITVKDSFLQVMNIPLKIDPEVEIIERPNITPPAPLQTKETNPNQLLPSITKNAPTTSTASSGKPKVKKRKTIDFNVLVQHDIKGLMQKKGSQSVQPSSFSSSDKINIPARTTPPPTFGETSTGPTAIFSEAVDTKPNLAEASAKLDDLASQEKVDVPLVNVALAVHEILPADNSTSTSQKMPETTTTSSETEEHAMDIDQPSDPVVVDQVAALQDDEATQASVTVQPMDKLSESDSPLKHREEISISQPMGISTSLSNARESTPMDVDPGNDTETFSPEMQPEMAVPSVFAQPSVVDTVQSNPINLSLGPDSIQTDSSSVELGQRPGIFGPEMRIVARQQGLKQNSRISVQFDIPEVQFRSVLNWINRSGDIASSACFTLGCYLTSDLVQDAKTTACQTFEAQISSMRSMWPAYGGLIMNANFNDIREDFSLSPPFQVTPENLVDVSPFLVLGSNVIELDLRQDLSHHTFVLHTHSPTQAQLKQIEERKQKEKEWHGWLHHISRPLKIPLRPVDLPSIVV